VCQRAPLNKEALSVCKLGKQDKLPKPPVTHFNPHRKTLEKNNTGYVYCTDTTEDDMV
jgi:hypothetical protein